MPSFMLLLRDDPTQDADLSPEAIQAIIEKYAAWGEGLSQQGKLAGSEKLVDMEGRVLRRGDGGPRVVDGPYADTKEVVGGYFTIVAESMEEAVEIASTCPHLESNGCIELRQIEDL